MADISDDAHHGSLRSVREHDLPNRILSGKQSARRSLIQNNHVQRAFRVAFRKIPPGLQRDSHGMEISLADDARESLWILALLVLHSLCSQTPAPVRPERQCVRQTLCLDS